MRVELALHCKLARAEAQLEAVTLPQDDGQQRLDALRGCPAGLVVGTPEPRALS